MQTICNNYGLKNAASRMNDRYPDRDILLLGSIRKL